ncbi:MAG: hypothetical protein LQ342_008533 [Letrouitia transgressa]|nr:MAG: hypothetical protein LQ342_008533 [Letrouitia transgressa]
MLGDTGIAVNPKDERYKGFTGKFAKHLFVNRRLPIFTDEYVDPEFGTGAVKITPAHDPNDFKIGQTHKLEFISIFHDNGTLNHNAGSFEGMKRFDARYRVIDTLKEEGLYVGWKDNPMKWVAGHDRKEAEQKAAAKWPNKRFELFQDPDVFDTWFTSGMWPFSTLGWPKNTQDMQNFYPTSLLETGRDILFFWVARMIMLGLKLTGRVPFKEVYCHSLVRDSEGRKMSKSLGNVIDPVDVIEGATLQSLHAKLLVGNLDPKELATATKFQKSSFPEGIPECGADALRFSLISYTIGGVDINLDIKVMYGYRRFCNKIYQATKYVLGRLSQSFQPLPASSIRTGHESLAELWILHKLTIVAAEVNNALTAREFSTATQAIYQYWYTNLCDVYIENSKSILQDGTPDEAHSAQQSLYTALEGGLTMIHPVTPFFILKAKYPVYQKELDNPKAKEAYELILAVSKAIRSLTAEYDIKDNANICLVFTDKQSFETCKAQLPSIKTLSGKALTGPSASVAVFTNKDPQPTGCVVEAVNANVAVYLVLKGRVNLDAEVGKAKTRLEKASETVRKQIRMMDGDGWIKMRAEAQEVEKRKLEDARKEVEVLEGSVVQFERLNLE